MVLRWKCFGREVRNDRAMNDSSAAQEGADPADVSDSDEILDLYLPGINR